MIILEKIVTNQGERGYYRIFEESGTPIPKNLIFPGHYFKLGLIIPNFNEDTFFENSDSAFFDLNPTGLVLSHSNWQNVTMLLNLNVIPPRFRSKLIMTHLNLIERDLTSIGAISEDEEEEKKEMISFNQRLKLNLSMYTVTLGLLERATGLNLKSSTFFCKNEMISKSTLLDWDKIGELPLSTIEDRTLIFSPGTFGLSSVFEKFENNQLI
jgi:hypothetical protein